MVKNGDRMGVGTHAIGKKRESYRKVFMIAISFYLRPCN